jgi:glyoxylase I family protein
MPQNGLRFSHVALSCRDLPATERFYSTHFGFTRARVVKVGDGQIVFIRSGDAYLELFAAEGRRDGSVPAADGPHGQGVRHIAFQTDDVDAKLAAMGTDARVTLGPLDFGAFIPGWRTVWVADPDDNIVEISQGFTDEERHR